MKRTMATSYWMGTKDQALDGQPYEGGIISLILMLKNTKLKEDTMLGQNHTAS